MIDSTRWVLVLGWVLAVSCGGSGSDDGAAGVGAAAKGGGAGSSPRGGTTSAGATSTGATSTGGSSGRGANGGSSQGGVPSAGASSGGSSGGATPGSGDSAAGSLGGSGGDNAAGTRATGSGGTSHAGASGASGGASVAGAAGDAGAAGGGGEGGEGPSCEHPLSFEVPNSNVAPYSNVNAGITMAGGKLALGYGTPAKAGPYLTLFDPVSQTFGTPKLLSVTGVSPVGTEFHVALTTLSDGHVAAAWTDQNHVYLSLGAETETPNAVKLSDTLGLPYPAVAIAPFFGGRVAVAWKESGSGSYNYHVLLDIFDPGTSMHVKYTIEAPSKVETTPRLYLTADRLVVELTQTVPLDSGDYVAKRNFFLTTVADGAAPGTLAAPSFIPNSMASAAPLILDAGTARVAYYGGSQILLSDLDSNFALTGTPLTVMPWTKYSSEFGFFHDGTGEQVVYSNNDSGLHSVRLDASHHPVGPAASFGAVGAYSTGMARTSSGVVAVWYQYSGATYVTPLCP